MAIQVVEFLNGGEGGGDGTKLERCLPKNRMMSFPEGLENTYYVTDLIFSIMVISVRFQISNRYIHTNVWSDFTTCRISLR